MPLNSVFDIMLFDIITAYENEVFTTLFRPQFNDTCYPWLVCSISSIISLYKVKRCLILMTREIYQHIQSVTNNNC